ncbi:hypothetical protein M404DRAFT_29490 [Pisolithus tinctorius Marx 270]|uniref:Myb/SANT-like domain-containing protein n=1 Tax=Pisolithus tinctorius Marx 270 TaxID=870435 RepID=A0A0C3NZK5_PISTI|nr:hypothetical protein M404DRAFT_29490 [Pisolithus tinctorius Marx 270]
MSLPPYLTSADTRCDHIRSGKIKDSKNVSIKWGSLKHMYNAIMTYCSGSGEHWDNENGANICGVADAEKWAKFVGVKRNMAMKPFCNKGWQYLPMMEDIFPQGGMTGSHAFHPGVLNPTLTVTTDSDFTVSVPPNPMTTTDSTTSVPSIPPSTAAFGGKRSFTVMSTDITEMASPSLLFSRNQHPPTTPILSIHSIISVGNTIRHLGDQLATTFMDPLIAVQMAMQMLYKDSEIPPHHHAFMMHQFSGISNPAAVFIALPDEQSHCTYVADIPGCH